MGSRGAAARNLLDIALVYCFVLTGVLGQGINSSDNSTYTISRGSVTCGYSHCCGIKSDGSAWCWGEYANFGQLGNNAGEGSLIPVPVSGGGSWIKLSAGNATTCGVRDDLSLWCWGLNDAGEAGISPSTSIDLVLVPTPIFDDSRVFGSPATWIDLSLGALHGCAIRSDYTMWCWGKSSDGALGNAKLASVQMTPVQVFGGGSWSRVACGADFTCAIAAANGTMFCFGSQSYGQCATSLTRDASDPILAPTRVARVGTDIWSEVYTGCMSSFAFGKQSDGSIWAWGDGRSGNLAVKEPGIVTQPQQVLSGMTWSDLASGQSYSLGIAENNKEGGMAWGAGFSGELGAGNITGSIFSAQPVEITHPTKMSSNEVVNETATRAVWSDLAGSKYQSCGIFNSKMFCWGSEQGGALGSEGGTVFTPREVEGNGTWGVAPTVVPLGPLPAPAPPSPPAPEGGIPQQPQGGGSNTGAIVGGVIGGLMAVCCIALAGILLWRRSRSKLHDTAAPTAGEQMMEPSKTEAVLAWAERKPGSLDRDISGKGSSFNSSSSDVTHHFKHLEFAWSDVHVIKTLGTGSFGQVFLAAVNHAKMAIKVLVDTDAVLAHETTSRITGSSSSGSSVPKAPASKLIQEASIMASLQHPNVVHLLGFCTSPPCLAIEYCPRGSLYDVLQKAKADPKNFRPKLTWRRRLGMAKEAAAGVLHLHSRSPPILHRDIKSPNFLVTGELSVKVCDMGLSKLDPRFSEDNQELGGSYQTVSTAGTVGNPRWLSPEVLNGGTSTVESDVFSFGVVLWELIVWEQPWPEANTWAVSSAVVRGERQTVPPYDQLPGFDEGLTPAIVNNLDKYVALIQRCWEQVPGERPSMAEITTELEQLIFELPITSSTSGNMA